MARLTGAEVCEEYSWLVTNGMSPLLACQSLGRGLPAMSKMLLRYGFLDLMSGVEREIRLQRNYKNERVSR
jgi:hypothetical protein